MFAHAGRCGRSDCAVYLTARGGLACHSRAQVSAMQVFQALLRCKVLQEERQRSLSEALPKETR